MARGHRLDFIKSLYVERKAGWTPELAVKLATCIQKQMRNGGGGFKWNLKLATKATGMSGCSCQMFVKELRLAQEQGWSIEQYFAKGRPFRPGKKVLA